MIENTQIPIKILFAEVKKHALYIYAAQMPERGYGNLGKLTYFYYENRKIKL